MNQPKATLRVEQLNWCVLVLAFLACWGCLWLCSHGPWWSVPLGAGGFALFNLTLFALLHESVHGSASPNLRRNEWIGQLAALALPTSLTMQRVAHLGHHRRNRTDAELYDYYLPHQSRWLRNLWLYAGNLLGAYWATIPLLGLVYLVAPNLWRSRLMTQRIAPLLGLGPYVEEMAQLPPARVWPEIARAFLYQALLVIVLGQQPVGWLLAHWAFACYWSTMQYADHAWSARDVTEGAWNLRVFAPLRWLALNYHLHLAHHRHPNTPWSELPRLVETGSYQPRVWDIYRSLWRGVRPAPPMGAPAQPHIFDPQAPAQAIAAE